MFLLYIYIYLISTTTMLQHESPDNPQPYDGMKTTEPGRVVWLQWSSEVGQPNPRSIDYTFLCGCPNSTTRPWQNLQGQATIISEALPPLKSSSLANGSCPDVSWSRLLFVGLHMLNFDCQRQGSFCAVLRDEGIRSCGMRHNEAARLYTNIHRHREGMKSIMSTVKCGGHSRFCF